MNMDNTETYRCLSDTELVAVTGAEGNIANAAIRVVTQWLQDNTFHMGFSWKLRGDLDCPSSPGE